MSRLIFRYIAAAALLFQIPIGPESSMAADTNGVMAYPSVLELVGEYTGHRDGFALMKFFNQPTSRIVRQQPTIALSDGHNFVIIAATISPGSGSAVNFSLEGAELLSMKKIRGDEWQVKAIPEKGTSRMALVVLRGEDRTVYPLLVAPPVPEKMDLSTVAFNEFFSSENARVDLNGDGRKDYQDDYVFLANYLIRQSIMGKDRGARKERALRRSLSVSPQPPKQEYNPDDFPD